MLYIPHSFRYPKGVYQFLMSDMLYWSSSSVITSFLAILLIENIPNATLTDVGIVIATFQLVNALIGLPSTFFTKSLSAITKQRLVSFIFFIYGISLISLSTSTSLWQFHLIYAFLGILEGISYPIKWTLFTNLLPRKNQETAWSLEDLVTAASGALASIVAGSLATIFGTRVLWILFGGLFVCNSLLFLTIRFKR